MIWSHPITILTPLLPYAKPYINYLIALPSLNQEVLGCRPIYSREHHMQREEIKPRCLYKNGNNFFFFNREGSPLFLASVSYQLQESNSITKREHDCKSGLQSWLTVFKCQLYQLRNYTMTWGKLFFSL